MAGLLAFALAAAVTANSPQPAAGAAAQGGAQVRASATATILRAEVASEQAQPGGLSRQISRRSDGRTTINFE